jgi:hypothetical protein
MAIENTSAIITKNRTRYDTSTLLDNMFFSTGISKFALVVPIVVDVILIDDDGWDTQTI